VFDNVGLARTEAPPSWLRAATDGARFEVRLEVRPASSRASGPARILALSATPAGGRDVAEQNLVVGQEGTDLVVRVRREDSNELGEPAIVVPDVLSAGEWRELHIVVGSGVVVAVDGLVRGSTPAGAWVESWDPDAVLTLGNTPSGTRPWQGVLRTASMTVGGDERDLLQDPELTVPDQVAVVPSRLRESRDRPLWRELVIGTAHLLAGAALALVLSRARPAWSALGVVGAVTMLSAAVNAAKFAVATRHPSLMTSVLQVVGAIVALSLVMLVQRRATRDAPRTAAVRAR
jgi:VanZ family protein